MKIFIMGLICISPILTLTGEESEALNELAKRLYEAEDKLDHLLYHFNHDVTRHEYRASKEGLYLAPSPKNKDSLHQKLKLIDSLNFPNGPSGSMRHSYNDAYNSNLGGPTMAIPETNYHPSYYIK